MNKNQLLALAAFITSLANGEGETPVTETAPALAGDAPSSNRRRGRPPTTSAGASSPSTPVEIVQPSEPQPPVESDPAPSGGKTIEDMRALIEPLIKGSWNGKPQAEWQPRGGEVKPIIAKYAPTLIQMDAKDYPAFEKDIEALLY